LITFPNELRESTGFAQSANARLSPPRLSAFSRAREAKADATASVKRLNNEYRYHLLTKAASRKPLNELLQRAGFRTGAEVERYGAGDRRGPLHAVIAGIML